MKGSNKITVQIYSMGLTFLEEETHQPAVVSDEHEADHTAASIQPHSGMLGQRLMMERETSMQEEGIMLEVNDRYRTIKSQNAGKVLKS